MRGFLMLCEEADLLGLSTVAPMLVLVRPAQSAAETAVEIGEPATKHCLRTRIQSLT